MTPVAVPESDWRYSLSLYEDACPRSALKGKCELRLSGTFRDGVVMPGQTRSPHRDFPLFEQDFDVDSVLIEGLDGGLKLILKPDIVTSRFILGVQVGGEKQTTKSSSR